jgi:hypothetical protein
MHLEVFFSLHLYTQPLNTSNLATPPLSSMSAKYSHQMNVRGWNILLGLLNSFSVRLILLLF